MNINETFTRLNNEQKRISREAKEAVTGFLKDLQSQSLSLTSNQAYALIEGFEGYIEVPVYGVRLHDGALEVSTDTDNEGNPSWKEETTRNDYNDNCTINWLSVLDSICGIIRVKEKKQPCVVETVDIDGKEYSIFHLLLFEGTEKEIQVPVASFELEEAIQQKIESGEYHECTEIDEKYKYHLPKEIDSTVVRDMIESIEDVYEI